MHAALAAAILSLTALMGAGSAVAAQDANAVGKAFADHCFSPYLTAETAQANLGPSGARIDFYDLRPFSSAAASPVTGRPATAGTDRRCEVAFDGADTTTAIAAVHTGLAQEGLAGKVTDVPETFQTYKTAVLIAAAQLNPNRIAVIQVGVRTGPSGAETFLNVERLTPLDEDSK